MSSSKQEKCPKNERKKLDSITSFQLKWLFYTTLFWGGILAFNLCGEASLLISYGIFCLFFISNGIYKHNIKAFLIFAFVYIVPLFTLRIAGNYNFEASFSVQMLLYSLILAILIFKKYYRLSITLCVYIAFYALAIFLGECRFLGTFYE